MLSFQQIILNLQSYWDAQGCALLQPYDMEVGAGTSHTATFLRAIGPEPWKAAYVQPSRRPKDGRYGDNPNRLQHYYQYQVVLKPAPSNILELYLGSLEALGFDLKKNPELILAAYNDSAKVTRDFNLNLLHRINRELGGNFQPENFQHWPLYQPITGHTKSYLISKIDQEVCIETLDLTVKFAAWEAIDMELSKKYDFTEIEHLATLAGLKVLTYFKDRKEYFTDALFMV
jgi:hypothetical protein